MRLPGLPDPKDVIHPTPRDVLFTEGTASLLHFRPRPEGVVEGKLPVLLVPSLINRWYILDLRAGASVAEALVDAGLDVYLLDWGVPRDEDRYIDWSFVLKRYRRFVRKTLRLAGVDQVGILGYCLGGTLSAIHTALATDPAHRYPNATSFARALRKLDLHALEAELAEMDTSARGSVDPNRAATVADEAFDSTAPLQASDAERLTATAAMPPIPVRDQARASPPWLLIGGALAVLVVIGVLAAVLL